MRSDESAAASAMAFIAAGVVFTAAIGIILYNVSNKVGEPNVSTNLAGSGGSARALLSQILDEGTGWENTTSGEWDRSGDFYPGILTSTGGFSFVRFDALDQNDGSCNVVNDNDCIDRTAEKMGLQSGDVELTFRFVVQDAACPDLPDAPDRCTYGSDLPTGALGTSSASTRVPGSGSATATITVYVFPA